MSVLRVPATSLVLLIGCSGSGKSTWAAREFAPYEVVSSDHARGVVANDPTDQSATRDAFDLVHHIVATRLRRHLLTVVDATNVQASARRPLLALAREHDVMPVAVVLDLPEPVLVARNEARTDRSIGRHVVRRQRQDLRQSLRGLEREGFTTVHVLGSEAEVDAAHVERARLFNDRRDLRGPFDVVGDVHGCLTELVELMTELGWQLERDDRGRLVGATHPEGRTLVFVGDLVDRGPDTPGVLRLAMGMERAGTALVVTGNHEDKLVRALAGRRVKVSNGLAESLEQLGAEPEEFRADAHAWMRRLVAHYVLDDGRLVVCHAGLKESYHGRASRRVRSFALYGDTTGESDEYGLPVRLAWADDYRGRALVAYGHTPTTELRWVNDTICLDTGVVFGGELSALRYPERELVSVPAHDVYYEPTRPLGPLPAPAAERPGGLDVADVLGDSPTAVETREGGRVSVRPENAAAAFEVMSRFAIDPRWLPYLPPTMSPVATSPLDGWLERPEEAFSAYAGWGVGQVVCEEKHMGSRAVVLVARDEAAAQRLAPGSARTAAVCTRTGRPFLAGDLEATLLARVRAAAEAAGLWDELATDVLLLDAELLPWSVKAEALLRDQYAAVGAAARLALPAGADLLAQTAARGLDVTDLLAQVRTRHANATAYVDAYRRYTWPTDGLDGVRLAVFQVLATAGRTWETTDHLWHLSVADRLVAADPGLFHATRRLVVDTADAAATETGVAWWLELTGSGGEGMVVKPLANLVRHQGRLVQPGLKVRGRDYLRIIYGPDYTEPQHLVRLKKRGLGHKRSLALREYALGLEALRRWADGQSLRRVHEAVFAVLALESEPVDPRL